MMGKEPKKIVMQRPKHDKKGNIDEEPAMIELRRMIREGELDPERAKNGLKDLEEGDRENNKKD